MSRIGRAIIEVLLRSESARAGAAAVKSEMQGIKAASTGAAQSVDSVGAKGQQAFDKVQGSANRTGASINRVDRAFDLVGRNAGKGLDRLGDALDQSNSGFTRVAGSVAGFVGKAAGVAGVAATFYQIGSSIREAFDPILRNERYLDNIAQITAATRALSSASSFKISTAGLSDDIKSQLAAMQAAVDAAKQDAKVVQDQANSGFLPQLLGWLHGARSFNGEEEARTAQDSANRAAALVREAEKSARLEAEQKATYAAWLQGNREQVAFLDRLEEIMMRASEQQRQQANAQLSEIAVSVRNLQQVINIRMRPGAVNLSSSP